MGDCEMSHQTVVTASSGLIEGAQILEMGLVEQFCFLSQSFM